MAQDRTAHWCGYNRPIRIAVLVPCSPKSHYCLFGARKQECHAHKVTIHGTPVVLCWDKYRPFLPIPFVSRLVDFGTKYQQILHVRVDSKAMERIAWTALTMIGYSMQEMLFDLRWIPLSLEWSIDYFHSLCVPYTEYWLRLNWLRSKLWHRPTWTFATFMSWY